MLRDLKEKKKRRKNKLGHALHEARFLRCELYPSFKLLKMRVLMFFEGKKRVVTFLNLGAGKSFTKLSLK